MLSPPTIHRNSDEVSPTHKMIHRTRRHPQLNTSPPVSPIPRPEQPIHRSKDRVPVFPHKTLHGIISLRALVRSHRVNKSTGRPIPRPNRAVRRRDEMRWFPEWLKNCVANFVWPTQVAMQRPELTSQIFVSPACPPVARSEPSALKPSRPT
ncbi:hypothetical protein BU16DRAFT_388523 [Lophium mytilinum]|uniref:Uncharacterized protein n=1 Tax=Lophium mytilinum TaxID=390894 RepID=A0A6A6QTE6_9PEZI|nr:hypothetical protein BU16DRAFT_388523 [Lophium mytilinum]